MKRLVLIFSLILLVGFLGVVHAQSCTDSDNGVNYYAKGQAIVSENGTSLSYNDACVYKLGETNAEFYVKEGDTLYNNKAECSGDNCYVAEAFCENSVKKWTVKTCPNGCSNGACLCPTTKCSDGNVYGPEKCTIKENTCSCPSCPAVTPVTLTTPVTCSAMPTCIGAKDTGQKDSNGCIIYSCQAIPVCQPTKCSDGSVYECKIINGICSCPTCPAQPTSFYISGVEGIKKTYSPSETLNLIVKGVEQDGTPATAEEGFNVQFYIDEWPLVQGQGSKGDNAYYKEGYWYGSIAIPGKLAGYRLQIFLYCSRDDSYCAKKYGIKGAQVENTYYFSVGKSTCSDSDGLDYYTKGFMKSGESDAGQWDACYNDKELVEYYCEGNNGAKGIYACPQGCKEGTCVKGEQVIEKITCKFEDTDKEQKCYLAGQFTDSDLGTKYCIAAAGSGSCVIAYTSYKGEQVTWKSSCGQYQYTTQDGNDKVIYFKCSEGETNITQVLNKGFRNVYFQCYDGAESKSTDREACKSADYWKKFAINFCESHCDKKTGKCGINSFSIGEECYIESDLCRPGETGDDCCYRWAKENSIAIPACVGGWTIENDKCSWSCKEEEQQCKVDSDCPQPNCGNNANCIGVIVKCSEGKCIYGSTSEPITVCKDSCPLDGKCYPFGYRKDGNFCLDDGSFITQKKSGACDNNFECSSNVCVNSQCISEGFLNKIINWFKKLFGG